MRIAATHLRRALGEPGQGVAHKVHLAALHRGTPHALPGVARGEHPRCQARPSQPTCSERAQKSNRKRAALAVADGEAQHLAAHRWPLRSAVRVSLCSRGVAPIPCVNGSCRPGARPVHAGQVLAGHQCRGAGSGATATCWASSPRGSLVLRRDLRGPGRDQGVTELHHWFGR